RSEIYVVEDHVMWKRPGYGHCERLNVRSRVVRSIERLRGRPVVRGKDHMLGNACRICEWKSDVREVPVSRAAGVGGVEFQPRQAAGVGVDPGETVPRQQIRDLIAAAHRRLVFTREARRPRKTYRG